jgi:prokaryotic ubiquitin-like protein Pup
VSRIRSVVFIYTDPACRRAAGQGARRITMSQEQTKRQGGGGGDDEDGADAAAAGQERREKLGEDVDTILDEIDDVLEENAEDFVRAYVQKGGE